MLLLVFINALQNLLERPVNRRAHSLALVELNRGGRTLADALRSELEFLQFLAYIHTGKSGKGKKEHTLYTSL